jgi:hypothetical protein
VELGDVLRRQLLAEHMVHLVLLGWQGVVPPETSIRLRHHPAHGKDDVSSPGRRLICRGRPAGMMAIGSAPLDTDPDRRHRPT